MSRRIIFALVFIVALTFMVSCSGGDENIITPEPVNRDNVTVESSGGTLCMGLWQVVIDAETGTGDIVQLRSADKIINVLGFMEPPALNMMDLDWPALVIADPIIEVGVILTHPMMGAPEFRGFDVRGVCFGPEVTNADGLTILTSPQYFKGVPFGYQDGLLGAPDSYANYSGLAGYKYFCDGLNETENVADFFTDTGNVADRGSFKSGQTNQRDYILDWTNSDHAFLIFNYAIYANYDWPVGGTGLDDFDVATANSAEAFACKVTELDNSLYFATGGGGGDISLQVEAWDWQGDISRVTIESVESGIIAPADYDVALGVFPSGASYGYEFYAVPGTPTEVGDLDILITVTDTKTFGECWFMDLLPTSNSKYNDKLYNCFIYTTTVSDCPVPIITGIDPDNGGTGASVDTVIDCAFIPGSSLAAKLQMTGEDDIDGTITDSDPVAETIDATFDLTDAEVGDWDVTVINGCGTPGTLTEAFEVTEGCGTMLGFGNGDSNWGGSGGTYSLYNYGACTVSRGTPRYVIGRTRSYASYICAKEAGSSWGVGYDFYQSLGFNISYQGMTCTSDNTIYFIRSGMEYMIYEITFNESSGFSGLAQKGPNLPGNVRGTKLCVDEDDNPIVLVQSPARIYHWNPTANNWGAGINLTSALPGSYPSIAWNTVKGEYLIISRASTNQLWSVTTAGVQTQIESNVFAFAPAYLWFPGIFTDQDDPECRIVCAGGAYSAVTNPRPLVRYDGSNYANKTESSINCPGSGAVFAWPYHLSIDEDYVYSRSTSTYYWARVPVPADW